MLEDSLKALIKEEENGFINKNKQIASANIRTIFPRSENHQIKEPFMHYQSLILVIRVLAVRRADINIDFDRGENLILEDVSSFGTWRSIHV